MMTFEHIRLQNWKNFPRLEIDLGARVFIVGANASGKSNLLDAVHFLKDIASSGFRQAIALRGGMEKLMHIGAGPGSRIEVYVTLLELGKRRQATRWSYTLQFDADPCGCGRILLEQVTREDEMLLRRARDASAQNNECGPDCPAGRDGRCGRNDAGRLDGAWEQTCVERPGTDVRLRALHGCFRSMMHVDINPQAIRAGRLPHGIEGTPSSHFDLLGAIAATPEKTRVARLAAISQALGLSIPRFGTLQLAYDAQDGPHLQMRPDDPRSTALLYEDQFSDGTLRLIGILWALLGGYGPLLLDNPELSLHTSIIKQLSALVTNTQKRGQGRLRQVMIATQSFDLLDTKTIDARETVVLLPNKKGPVARLASDIASANRKLAADFTMADAVIPLITPDGIQDVQRIRMTR